jgi:asparagine synthase (glutamine-hydrolysing)
MCGIAGIVSTEAPVDVSLVAAMNHALIHRGPDDAGEWLDSTGRVALASRRLAILDRTQAGHQPMVSANGMLCLVFNGEIYNYVELRDQLAAVGHRFRTHTDTEVLLVAYEQWGLECVERFNGMFAFALWDSQRRRLVAARDRFGEKPFYYHRSPRYFAFASEIKALVLDPSLRRDIDDVAVSRYLLEARVDGDERTFLRNVRQLPPAHLLIVDAEGELTQRKYWTLPLHTTRQLTSAAAADEFRALLTDSIRLRLRSDVPVGSSLSGGLDSSSIVCTMKRLLEGSGAQQKTFSARYRVGSTDEGRYIDAVAGAAGVDAHHIWIEGEDLLDDVDRFVWYQDEPVPHTSQFAQWKVMELARDAGVTVLLDGQGADEVVGGYPSPTFGYRYAELAAAGRLGQLTRELIAFRTHHGSLGPALRYLGAAMLPPRTRGHLRRRFHDSSGLAPHRSAGTATRDRPRAAGRLRAALYETLTVTSLPSLLRFADRNSMAFSREARLPFLDHRLVEFVYTLPSEHLVREGTSKVLLRSAMRGVIPDVIADRMDKIGFATPEREWFVGPLRPWLEGKLHALKRRDLVSSAAIDQQWRRLLGGGARTGNLWRLANLEAWLQKFVEAPTHVSRQSVA